METSPLIDFLTVLHNIFKTLIFYLILLPLALIFLTPIYIFRYFVGKVLVRCNPSLDKILTTRSSILGADKICKLPKSTLVVCSVFEGTIELDQLRKDILKRTVHIRDENNNLIRPELQQYIKKYCGFSFWAYDHSFNIENHVQMMDDEKVRREEACGPETLCKFINDLVFKPFSPQRPLWEILLVNNYKDKEPEAKVSSVLIFRIHHSLADGFSILSFMKDLVECKDENFKISRYVPQEKKSFFRSFFEGIALFLLAPYDVLSEGPKMIDPVNSWHPPAEKLLLKSNSAISRNISINWIKEVKNCCKATFTAVILECFTAATRKFMLEAGHEVPKVIHCLSPLPVPGHPEQKLRNYLAGCCFTLPVGLADPQKRLRAIEKNLLKIRRSKGPMGIFYASILLGGLFRWILSRVGPENEWIYNEHKTTSIFFGGGTAEGNCGMGFSAVSYNGNIRFYIAIDEGIVPSSILPAQKLADYFFEELDILKREAYV